MKAGDARSMPLRKSRVAGSDAGKLSRWCHGGWLVARGVMRTVTRGSSSKPRASSSPGDPIAASDGGKTEFDENVNQKSSERTIE